jgi:serine/threonine protein kinase
MCAFHHIASWTNGYVQYPHLAPFVNRANGELVGCLKFVEDGKKENEIEILQYFASLPSEFNHCVRPFAIWPVTGGSIIAMPAAGNRLTSLTELDKHLWSLTIQLFESVKFMHDNNVAHMDFKPGNILIPSAYGRLTIVDFGLSIRLRNETQLCRGFAGTEGYIAPEVGKTKLYSPIRADLWSVGKVVQELCMLCSPSTSRDWLLDLSKQELLNDDPSKRPMMSDVLERMSNFDAFVETQDRISSYQKALGGRKGASWRKIGWSLFKADEVANFRQKISQHIQNITLS